MQASRTWVLAVSAWLAGCSGSPDSNPSAAHCFVVEDGDERTHVVISMETPAKVSISDAGGANAQVTLGRIEGNSFVYGDGSRLRFDDQGVVGEGGLIAAIAGRRVPCP